jgi:hypothetical protein
VARDGYGGILYLGKKISFFIFEILFFILKNCREIKKQTIN